MKIQLKFQPMMWVVAALCASVFFMACEKEVLEKTNESDEVQAASTDLLRFETYEEYKQALDELSNGDENTKNVWEKSKKFKSFGSQCDEIYSTIVPESFKNTDEVKAFVEKHKEYLKLMPDENGELVLETVLGNAHQRYFINSDRMFAIGQMVFKVFETGTAQTDIRNIEKLKKIDETAFLRGSRDSTVVFNYSKVQDYYSSPRDIENNWGIWQEARNTNRSDRTYIRVSIEYTDVSDQFSGQAIGTWYSVCYMLRPYKKVLGIWYFCSRTLSGNVKVAVGSKLNNGQWSRGIFEKSFDPRGCSSISGTIDGDILCLGSFCRADMHFDAIDSWADTPSTGPARIQLSTHLF